MPNNFEIDVEYDSVFGQVSINPGTLALGLGGEEVIWQCPNLPQGGTLEIVFEQGPWGPFATLLQLDPGTVIGSGSATPSDDPYYFYFYSARVVVDGVVYEASGILDNSAGHPNGHPVGCELPRSGPPCV